MAGMEDAADRNTASSLVGAIVGISLIVLRNMGAIRRYLLVPISLPQDY
jgi:hypothetical protein